MIDFDYIQKQGLEEGLRELNECRNSKMLYTDAIARKIHDLQKKSEQLLSHAIFYNFLQSEKGIKYFFSQDTSRPILFETILSLDVAQQLLSITAEKQGVDVIDTLCADGLKDDRYFLRRNMGNSYLFKQNVSSDDFIDRINSNGKYGNWTWEKDLKIMERVLAPVEDFRRATFGQPLNWMDDFFNNFPDDDISQKFKGDVLEFLKQSAIKIWQQPHPVIPLLNAHRPLP